VGGDIKQKAEMLKDILALTNSWRTTDAYILVGVREVKGGRSIVQGVAEHLDDASLQQFVNGKTQRPIRFSYQTFVSGGLPVGIIHIPIQLRPVYLRDRYGSLKPRVVYVRRGSSTAEASPEEVSDIGASGSPQPAQATNPKKSRLTQALVSKEPVWVIEWIEGRGVLAMRSIPMQTQVTKVNDNYAVFQRKAGSPISRAFEHISLSENPDGALQADLD
jgi:hypothetical protein